MPDMLSDAQITQIRERQKRPYKWTDYAHRNRDDVADVTRLLALVDQLRQEQAAVEKALADHGLGRQDGEFPKLIHRLAEHADAQEIRAEQAEAACARLRTALEAVEALVKQWKVYQDTSELAAENQRRLGHVQQAHGRQCEVAVLGVCIGDLEAALALPDDGAESLTHEEKNKVPGSAL